MTVEIGLIDEYTNTQYAPLAALFVHYQQAQVLSPLQRVSLPAKKRFFSPVDKLLQVFLSVLAGCRTLVEVNSKLRPEVALARSWGWPHFADQSTLSRQLDQLSLKQVEQIRLAATQIWHTHSRTGRHDWRGFLWLDYDFSPLPCGAQAEASQKGYFGEKKAPDGSLPGSAR